MSAVGTAGNPSSSSSSNSIPSTTNPNPIWYTNTVARVYCRSKHKHFRHLLRDLIQFDKLPLDYVDTDYVPQERSPSPCDSDSEASESTLELPSDTDIFGLQAKHTPSQAPSGPPAKRQRLHKKTTTNTARPRKTPLTQRPLKPTLQPSSSNSTSATGVASKHLHYGS